VGAVEVKWLHGGRREERGKERREERRGERKGEERGKERREERRGERKGEERVMGKNTDHSSIYASTLNNSHASIQTDNIQARLHCLKA
jgi:hypothetical protein